MAYLALYRRYRPRNFDGVVGQEYVTRILKNQILSGRVGHAYLFSGIRGTGKTSIAKIFARAINCEHNEDGNPCNACETCLNIETPGIMDIIEIDAASNRGVDEIREIREKVKYPPTLGKYKVYIIDEVHMLTKEAFNALLKTLEEPPPHIVFILATTEPNKLPMTILSRCQSFNIKPISAEMIARQIEYILSDIGVSMEKEAMDMIAYRGDSSMRDALSLLDQVIDIREGDKTITKEDVMTFMGMVDEDQIAALIAGILADDKKAVLLRFKELREAGRDSSLIFGQLIEYLRKVLIVKTTGAASQEILSLAEADCQKLGHVGVNVPNTRFYEMIDFLIEEKNKLRYSGLASVIIEMALLKLCDSESLAPKQMVKVERKSSGVEKRPLPQGQGVLSQKSVAAEKVALSKGIEQEAPPLVAQSFSEDLEASLPSSEKEERNTAVLNKGPEKKVNIDTLYTSLIQRSQQEKPVLVRFLMCGKLAHKGEEKLVLRFNGDGDGNAALGMLKMPKMYEFVKNTLCEIGKADYTLEVETTEKKYDQMSMVEKTKNIINDERVEIVETKE